MKKRRWFCLVVVAAVIAVSGPASARTNRSHRKSTGHAAHRYAPRVVVPARITPPPEPPQGPYVSALLIDSASGTVLFSKSAEESRPPASMVKMMVALLTFEAIERGDVKLDQLVPISVAASRTGGSGVMLKGGERLPLEDLVRAMLVASANGACVAIAETIAGSQLAMIERMNARARELGMTGTQYRTVNGLPPPRGKVLPDMTSAQDQAILARKLLEHSIVLRYSSEPTMSIRNGTVVLRNTNHLVGHMDGADGLKTGYFRKAGFNITATASRDGLRLLAVVMGCPTLQSRFQVAQELMEWGFANFARLNVVDAGEPLSVEVKVADGASETVRPIAADHVSYIVRKGQAQDLHVTFQIPSVISAPIAKHQALGEVVVRDRDQVVGVVPAVSPIDINRAERGAYMH
jgi:D-alanyl-D-alanine carboxypeptidase (penicillin-binding protein 5/6)